MGLAARWPVADSSCGSRNQLAQPTPCAVAVAAGSPESSPTEAGMVSSASSRSADVTGVSLPERSRFPVRSAGIRLSLAAHLVRANRVPATSLERDMPAKKPLAIVTRKLPDPIETRMRELFAARLNVEDKPMNAAALAK